MKQESYRYLTRQSNNWTSCFHIGKWSVFTNQRLDPMIPRSSMQGKTDSNILGTLFFKGFGKFFNWFSFSLRSTDLLIKSSFCLVGITFFRIFWLRLKARPFYHWGLFFKSSTFRV
jgi:hypothetical protein